MRAVRFARCGVSGRRVSLSSSPSRHQYLARLRLEPLEDRRMLSVLMVDADTAPGGDGLAWATAYNDLQPALAQAAVLNADVDPANNIDQIWIAEGTYKPSALLEMGDARSASFSLVGGVTLYGGFTGTETAIDQRDWSAHITTLSGDLGTIGDSSDNAYTVVYCATGITAGINGVSITGGNANGSSVSGHPERTCGGGVYSSGALTITNSTLSANSGSGVYSSGTLTVTSCTFSGNSGFRGGGVYNRSSDTAIFNGCTFLGNSGNYGGGIYNYSSRTVILNGCTFSGNSGNSGGGIYNTTSGKMTITDSTVSGNSASVEGGGVYNFGILTVDRCTISGNSGGNVGGIANIAVLRVTNSTISGNVATGSTGVGGGLASNFAMTVTNCTLSDNSAASGGGVYITGDSSTTTVNNTIVAGNIASSGPDVYLSSGTLSGSYNLLGDGSGQTALINGVNGNQVGTSAAPIDPLLSADGHLLLGSPAINKGSNALAVDPQGNPLTVDLDGNPRIIYPTVDIGAYEFRLVADADYSGTVDAADAQILAAHWGMLGMTWAEGDFNGDGLVNAADASILAANWGSGIAETATSETSGPSEAVEPATGSAVPLVGPMLPSQRIAGRQLIAPVGRQRAATRLEAGESLATREVSSIAHETAIADEYGDEMEIADTIGKTGPPLRCGPGILDIAQAQLAWSHEFMSSQVRRRLTPRQAQEATAVDALLATGLT